MTNQLTGQNLTDVNTIASANLQFIMDWLYSMYLFLFNFISDNIGSLLVIAIVLYAFWIIRRYGRGKF